MRSRTGIRFLTVLGVLCSVALASTAHARTYIMKDFRISAAQEVPTNASPGTGTGTITVNTDTNILHYDISYSGLTSNETAEHIHGPAARGVNAGVLVGLPADPTPADHADHKVGDWNYPEGQETNILNGLTYVNIHTVNNGGGEIRGQIEVVQVPSLGQWGLLALAMALVAGGTTVMSRRRRTTLA